MRTDIFAFDLPAELIAQHPVEPRDRARLMVVRRAEGSREHRVFAELPELLEPGDLLVRNDTRVLPARLIGRREATGGRWEGLYLGERADGSWEVLATTRGKPAAGERIVVASGLVLTLVARQGSGRWIVAPDLAGRAPELLERFGAVPLPPYIRRGRAGPEDRGRYQTVYARAPGAVAAPTAGLHFTEELLGRLAARGVGWADVTLHVGAGTFRPIEADEVERHELHAEWAELTPEVAERLGRHRGRGGRIVAVGTTAARTLETAAASGTFRPLAGTTDLYIRPGYTFRGLDALITNFHLPRSSLLVLVGALIGVEALRAAYAEAVRERYRFYSYGDAMLILP